MRAYHRRLRRISSLGAASGRGVTGRIGRTTGHAEEAIGHDGRDAIGFTLERIVRSPDGELRLEDAGGTSTVRSIARRRVGHGAGLVFTGSNAQVHHLTLAPSEQR